MDFNKQYLYDNPVIPGNVLWWGYGYPVEMFYIIDFFDIKDNMYVVSTYGRVFSFFTGKEMRGISRSNISSFDLLQVNLRTNSGNSKMIAIDKIVATAFLPKTEDDIINKRNYINHKDYIMWNNTVWNLEWCNKKDINKINIPKLFNTVVETTKQNNIYYGDEHVLCRISDEQVHIICKALQDGHNQKTCCELAGLEYNSSNMSIISNIRAGRRRTNISSQYNITKNNQLCSYSQYREQIINLLIQGMGIKEVYDIIKINIPYKEGESDKQHYDRVRIEIGKVRRQLKSQ